MTASDKSRHALSTYYADLQYLRINLAHAIGMIPEVSRRNHYHDRHKRDNNLPLVLLHT
jgi:hypothetical protein